MILIGRTWNHKYVWMVQLWKPVESQTVSVLHRNQSEHLFSW